MNVDTQTTESTTPTPPSGSPGKPAKRATKPAAKRASKAPAKAAAAKKSTAKLVKSAEGGTPLKTLLAKLKLPADGRAARRKLRAANFSWHDKRTRWNLNAKQLAQAEAILRGNEE